MQTMVIQVIKKIRKQITQQKWLRAVDLIANAAFAKNKQEKSHNVRFKLRSSILNVMNMKVNKYSFA